MNDLDKFILNKLKFLSIYVKMTDFELLYIVITD